MNHSLFCVQPRRNNRDEWFRFAAEEKLGLEALEFAMPPLLGADRNTQKDYADKYCRSGRRCTLHGSFMDINPGTSDPEIQQVSRRRCVESMNIAKMLHAEHVIMHASAHPRLNGAYLEMWAGRCADFYSELAEEYGIPILIENSMDEFPEAIEMLMERVHSPKVGVCLDIGHAAYSKTSLEKWFEDLGEYIRCLHLSDNYGVFDDHIPIGRGDIDWTDVDRYWREIGAPGIMTLEVGSLENVKQSLAFLRRNNLLGAVIEG